MPGGNNAAPIFGSPGLAPAGLARPNIPFTQPTRYSITGTTRDSSGVALAGCTVEVYITGPGGGGRSDEMIATIVSNSAGVYSIEVTGQPGRTFYCVAYKVGSPDVAGTTINTLTAVAS